MRIDAIQASFPNFPDQVIESWLLPFAIERGWPPYFEDEHTPSKGWEYLLLMKPKAFWLDCKWSLQSIDLADSSLARSSASAITQLGMAVLINEQNPYSNIVNSKERFLRAFSCLFRHHQHAIPPILLRQEDGF